MKVHLLDYFRTFLLQAPLYTSTFLIVQGWEDPTLVLRVEELRPFQTERYRARVGVQAWHNEYCTWVVAVPFWFEMHSQVKVAGIPCLNPRQATDYTIIQKFTCQQSVRFLLLSPDLEESETVQIPWTAKSRTKVCEMVNAMDRAIIGERHTSIFDPDFDLARQQFQSLHHTLDNLQQRVTDG
ncbi:MAG: hypothetical protein AB7G75_02175 [Candidatus Binatia bacterium]